jgi:sugar/nucleoside kinase (ribokinase family)
MGNALIDVLVTLDNDDLLQEMELPKGSMTLIDTEKFHLINKHFSTMQTHLATGGSAGNTIRSMAWLGAATGFIGKVGHDTYGEFYANQLKARSTEALLSVSPELPSGVASTFISTDGERTFGTYLGAAATMHAEELTATMFKGYTYLYLEGYMVQDHHLILRAIELAKDAGLQICIDLASYNIVEQERDFFALLINKYVDIVFANEEEAKAFTGQTATEALDILGRLCSIAVVKVGAAGSYIKKGSETIFVDAGKATKVDSTGAGDYYAAGFLYGLTSGFGLEKCGKIGSLLARHIIQVIGAELPEQTWNEIKKEVDTY